MVAKSLKSSKKRQKSKKEAEKDDRSALTSTFYKDTFVVRYQDKRVRVIGESEFNMEVQKIRSTDPYWQTIKSI